MTAFNKSMENTICNSLCIELEKLKKEGAEKLYFSVEKDYENITKAYDFLCAVASAAGRDKPENSKKALQERLFAIISSEDYKGFLCVYNAVLNEKYNSDIAEMRKGGQRKHIADVLFMRSLLGGNPNEQEQCEGFEEYARIFGFDKELAEEIFIRWEQCVRVQSSASASRYFALLEKCTEYLSGEQREFIKSGEREIAEKILPLSFCRGITNDFVNNLINRIEGFEYNERCDFVKKCIYISLENAAATAMAESKPDLVKSIRDYTSDKEHFRYYTMGRNKYRSVYVQCDAHIANLEKRKKDEEDARARAEEEQRQREIRMAEERKQQEIRKAKEAQEVKKTEKQEKRRQAENNWGPFYPVSTIIGLVLIAFAVFGGALIPSSLTTDEMMMAALVLPIIFAAAAFVEMIVVAKRKSLVPNTIVTILETALFLGFLIVCTMILVYTNAEIEDFSLFYPGAAFIFVINIIIKKIFKSIM